MKRKFFSGMAKSDMFLRLSALAGLAFLIPVTASLYYAGRLADGYYVRQGEPLHIAAALPITAEPVAPAAQAAHTGSAAPEASLRLFGIFPIKTVEMHPTEKIMLIPSGAPFGVRMLMDGIMVIGFGEVAGEEGHCCPALEAGLQEGDIILEVNREALNGTTTFRETATSGQPMLLTVQRDEQTLETTLYPVYSLTDNIYQTGLWVRDSTAGIGTLTYCEPETGCFGGLGHPICDSDTGELIPLGSGEADSVTISGTIRGTAGAPGQLQGYFSADEPIGTLSCNSRCGIFGQLDSIPDTPAVPMALKQEIVLGEAVILTTVSGTEPEAYTVEITSLDYTDDTRNMVIEVTDERLLDITGGIVQGMSGSPILQDGQLVGAVTHVFVADPTKGYGIFAENMYEYTRSCNETTD